MLKIANQIKSNQITTTKKQHTAKRDYNISSCAKKKSALAKQPRFCSCQVKWNYSHRRKLAGQAIAARSWPLGQLSRRSQQQWEKLLTLAPVCGFPIARRFPYGRGSGAVPVCSVLRAGLDRTRHIPTGVALRGRDSGHAAAAARPQGARTQRSWVTHMHVYMCTCGPRGEKVDPPDLRLKSDPNPKCSSVDFRNSDVLIFFIYFVQILPVTAQPEDISGGHVRIYTGHWAKQDITMWK